MSDDDLNGLRDEAPYRRLAGLEADVWREVEARAAVDRRMLAIGGLQGGALAAVFVLGLSWGAMSARLRVEARGDGVFSPHMALAPSSRLMESDG